MRLVSRVLTFVLAAALSSTSLASDGPVIYVAGPGHTTSGTDLLGSPEYSVLIIGVNINGYDCVTLYTGGCPAGTAIINDDGNLGCATGCTGSCTRCAGNTTAGTISLCQKKSGQQCTLIARKIDCGNKGTGTCFTATGANGDNAGCDCTTPPTFPGATCSFNACQ